MSFTINLLFLLILACDMDQRSRDTIVESADIVSVSVNGSEANYTFSVGIKSADTGCKQYANWWEVVSEDGELIYRRILGHSHTNEQPFVRSGGKVSIQMNQTVIVRAHMNNSGYGTVAFRGSVENGFVLTELDKDFASDLETISPQPSGCVF